MKYNIWKKHMKYSTQNSVNQVQIKYSAWSTHMKYV